PYTTLFRSVGVDLVGRHRRVVAAGRADLLDHGIDRHVGMQRLQAVDLGVDLARLHGAAAGTVDAQDDPPHVVVLEGAPQGVADVLGGGVLADSDHALDADHGGMAAGLEARAAKRGYRDHHHQQRHPDAAGDPPAAPVASILRQHLAHQPFDTIFVHGVSLT